MQLPPPANGGFFTRIGLKYKGRMPSPIIFRRKYQGAIQIISALPKEHAYNSCRVPFPGGPREPLRLLQGFQRMRKGARCTIIAICSHINFYLLRPGGQHERIIDSKARYNDE